MHNEALLEIIILKVLEHTIANSSILLVTSITVEVIVSLLLRMKIRMTAGHKLKFFMTQIAHDL